MRISLVVTTYNWPAALDLCLASVARQRRLPDEVVVADDGSGDETQAVVAAWQQKLSVPLLHSWQADLGYRLARSRNLALAVTEGDYVLFVDGDMLLHPEFVADHARFARRGAFVQGPRTGTDAALGARLIAERRLDVSPLERGVRRRVRAFRWLTLARAALADRTGTFVGVHGCNQAYWRDDLLRVNGFDESFEGWGPEDRELAARLYHSGVRRLQLRWAALAVHLHHPTRRRVSPYEHVFAQTLAGRRTRCERGVDAHLAALAHARQPTTVELQRATEGTVTRLPGAA